MKLQRRITTRECPAPRPSVVCDRALGDDATIGVDANLALDPVVSNLDNPADASNSVRSSLAPCGPYSPSGSATISTKSAEWLASGLTRLVIWAETSLDRC